MKHYFIFRFKQFFRVINNGSILPFVILIILIFIFNYELPNNWLNLFFYFIPIYLFHSTRKDLNFIKKVFTNYRLIIFTEYLIIYLIILTILQFKSFPFYLHLIGIIPCFALPFIEYRTKNWTSKINLNFLSIDFFEWKTAIRFKPFLFIIYYLVLLFSTFHPFTLCISSFFFCEFILKTYSPKEPKELIVAYFRKKNLEKKLRQSYFHLTLLLSPIYLVFTILNYTQVYFLIGIMFVFYIFMSEAICNKYINHNQNSLNDIPINLPKVLVTLIQIALILPAIVDYFKLKKMAKKNISKYVRN